MATPWTVYQTPKSRSWIIDFHYRDEHGLPKRFRKSAGRGVGKKDAERKARALYREMQRDPIAFVDTIERGRRTASDAQPFAQVADMYFNRHVVPRLKHSTVRTHEQMIRVHLKPYFGTTDIRSIGKAEVGAYVAAKRRSGCGQRTLSKKSINNHLSVLSSIFDFAHNELGLLVENPTKGKGRRLKPDVGTHNWINTRESVDFLDAIRSQDPHFYPVFHFALRTGMRQGELIALRWQDVHLDGNPPVIVVQRSMTHGVLGSTKSNRARRVPIPADLLGVLQSMSGEPSDLVFTKPDGAQLTGNVLKNPMRRAKLAIGLPDLRFHDLRHSYASQLTAKGVPLQFVQRVLGHSDIKTTAKYSHHTDSMVADAVASLDRLDLPLAAK
jgi:integrase